MNVLQKTVLEKTVLQKTKNFVSQKDVLQNYLNSLLNEFPDSMIIDESRPKFTPTETLYHSVLTEIENAEEHLKPLRWATEYFSCLPITVDEVTLLVPLRQVRMVLPLSDDIQVINELPSWMNGSLERSTKHIKVVDMKQIAYRLIPEFSKPPEVKKDARLVVINEGKWGIDCDSVGKVQQLDLSDIRWRGSDSSYRWVAGLSIKHQLAVVDTKRVEFAMALERPLV